MKNFSGVCQAAGADKPLRAFFIWITNIVTLQHRLHRSPESVGIGCNNISFIYPEGPATSQQRKTADDTCSASL